MHESERVLRAFYAAEGSYLAAGGPGAASTEVFAECLHPDIVIHEATSLPYGGEWRGLDGVAAFLAKLSETYDSASVQDRSILVDGPVAVVLTHSVVRSRRTGRSMQNAVLQRNLVVDGLITEMRPFHWDTAAVQELTTP